LRMLDEMKDTLIRDVSHELKTPVAKHAMQLEILKSIALADRLSEKEQKALVVMEESIRRQEAVIRNLLDLSRLEAGVRQYQHEPVQLDRLLAKVVEDYRHASDVHNIEVDVTVPPLVISSDAEMLWHLFSNIVNNSIKFRPKGVPGKISISAEQRNGEVQVSVRDDGIGMDAEHIDKAFSRFYQASTSCEGSGVGLTICQMIAQGLGGRILLESEGRGKGVTVTVALPFSQELT
jgi:signal transduction histidine kinase